MSNIDIYGMKDSAGNTLYFPNGGGGGASLLRASYEESPATAAHAIDDILYYNNKFYDVTSAIAIGDTLTVSSGSTVGNISERIGGMSYEVFGIPGGGSGGTVIADDVSYDNTSSGLTATNVQDAIDELNSNKTGFVDYSTVVHSVGGLYSGGHSSYTWTATQDCFCIVSMVCVGSGGSDYMTISIDDVSIPTMIPFAGSNLIIAPVTFYLKKGQKLHIDAPQSSNAGSAYMYGLL